MFGCRKVGGEPFHTIKLHAVLVQELWVGGRKAQRALDFVRVKGDGRGRCFCEEGQRGNEGPVKHPAGTVLPSISTPHHSRAGRRQRSEGDVWGEDWSSPSRGGRQAALRLEQSQSRAPACYMLQQKAYVVFSEPPYFDMNRNTF